MIINYLMKPGIKLKRWVFISFIGIMIIGFEVGKILVYGSGVISPVKDSIAVIIGLLLIAIGVIGGGKAIIKILNAKKIDINLNDKEVEELIDEDRLLVKGPKIVVIGGGTGLSTMLRGLKKFTDNITAIVTVGDDGGGSGKIREDFGMLPPGDIRNCILALADTEPTMEKLLQYRFKGGALEGQNFGNLFLAAMAGISDNFEEAVQKMSSVLAVTGKVLPVTLDDMKLVAVLENGNIIEGESIIPTEATNQKSKIKDLKIKPENAQPLIEALKSIEEADAIIMGPGSLYTSIVPNLLVSDISDTIRESNAIKIYVSNIMTQPGETDDFTASDHLKTIIKYGGEKSVEYVIANNGSISEEILERYEKVNSKKVKLDRDEIEKLNIKIVETDLVKVSKGYVKHQSNHLAEVLMDTIIHEKLINDGEKYLEYIHVQQKRSE